MRPKWFVLAVGLSALICFPARAAEQCKVGSTAADGQPRYTDISLDLASSAKLDPSVLPEGSSAVMCRRTSIVPRPEDVRVLSEWGVAFGIVEPGPRALWISVNAGIVEVTVDNGKLKASEKAAVKEWREAAQLHYFLALAEAERRAR